MEQLTYEQLLTQATRLRRADQLRLLADLATAASDDVSAPPSQRDHATYSAISPDQTIERDGSPLRPRSAEAAKVAELYQVRWDGASAPPHVSDFLETRSALCAVLLEAPHRIGEFFPDATLVLEVKSDPEIDDPKMVLTIEARMSPAEAVAALTAMNKAWGLQARRQANRALVITVRPKRE